MTPLARRIPLCDQIIPAACVFFFIAVIHLSHTAALRIMEFPCIGIDDIGCSHRFALCVCFLLIVGRLCLGFIRFFCLRNAVVFPALPFPLNNQS